MKYIRFKNRSDNSICYGKTDSTNIEILSNRPWETHEVIGETKFDDNIILQAPVEPSKIICVGLNYQAHVEASHSANEAPSQPLLFFKPPSSIIAQNEEIILPDASERVDYEAELGVVIGKEAKDISEADANDYIFGLTCVNDVTARDLQKKDKQWARAKGFDTFCPVGPHIVRGVDYSDILVEAILNGKVMQSGRTSLMIFSVPFLISYISKIMTLLPGDLISTGTPAGISPMKSDDIIEVKIESVGSLSNRVK